MNYWTLDKLAKHVKEQGKPVSTSYLRRLIRQGQITAIKPGIEWLLTEDEAQRWINHWLQP